MKSFPCIPWCLYKVVCFSFQIHKLIFRFKVACLIIRQSLFASSRLHLSALLWYSGAIFIFSRKASTSSGLDPTAIQATLSPEPQF
jgi:hypothetical protein